jgi:hypothetical protein
MVTLTFQGTPAEINAEMHAFMNLSTRAATLPAPLAGIGQGPQKTRTEILARIEEAGGDLDQDQTTPQSATRAKDPVLDQPAAPAKRKRRTKAELEAAKTGNGHAQPPLGDDELESAEDESPAIVQVQKQQASVAAPIVNKESVHQALQQVNVAVGLPKAREILQAFGVNRISEIKEDQYKPFIEKCNEAVMLEG